MLFVEFFIAGVILIAILLLELELRRQNKIKMPRPAGVPPPPTERLVLNRSTLRQRRNRIPQNLRMTDEEADVLSNKVLYMPWPEDPDWYIDFGSVYMSIDDVNLIGKTPQKLGNWAEYLFQNVVKNGAQVPELRAKSKPLVEGVPVDGTYVHQEPGDWSVYGLLYGRPYEIKSSVNDKFIFKQDNVKALVMTNGFFIMCRTAMIPEGVLFDYRGYTMHDIIEMGVPGRDYAPNRYVIDRAKIVAANYQLYGQTPPNPGAGVADRFDIRLRLPGDGGRLIRIPMPRGNGVMPEQWGII